MVPGIQRTHTFWRRHSAYFLLCWSCMLLGACSSVPPAPHAEAGASRQPGARVASSAVPVLPPAKSGRGGYYQDDGPGDQSPDDLLATPDAEPKIEPYARRGNNPYVVFGKTYTPVLDERPLKQRGRGSWYGKKFHGQRTSSGEPYDMYKMTAAHPTMPIPSYARVTNVANGRQVIVRVNDRGPFLSNRIIDLSYTAALKLGYLQQGSAELEVERLLPDDILRMTANRPTPSGAQAPQPDASVFAVPVAAVASESFSKAAAPGGGFYLQLGAYSQAGSADTVRSRLQNQWSNLLPEIEVAPHGALFRLYSGPFASREQATAVARRMQEAGAAMPLVVQR